MASYDKPIKGKMGAFSTVSKNMCFGICCDTSKEAKSELVSMVGYWDAQKYRWRIKQWTAEDIKNDEERRAEYLKEKQERKERQRAEYLYRKECRKFVKENKDKFKDKYREKIEKDMKVGGYRIKLVKRYMEDWMKMPYRLKEVENVAED